MSVIVWEVAVVERLTWGLLVVFPSLMLAIACVNLTGLTAVFVLQALTGTLVEMTQGEQGETTLLGYRLVFAAVAALVVLATAGYLSARDAPP